MTPQTKPQTEQDPATEPSTPPTATDPIDAFVEEVKVDAEGAPGSYARETIVPEGGE